MSPGVPNKTKQCGISFNKWWCEEWESPLHGAFENTQNRHNPTEWNRMSSEMESCARLPIHCAGQRVSLVRLSLFPSLILSSAFPISLLLLLSAVSILHTYLSQSVSAGRPISSRFRVFLSLPFYWHFLPPLYPVPPRLLSNPDWGCLHSPPPCL